MSHLFLSAGRGTQIQLMNTVMGLLSGITTTTVTTKATTAATASRQMCMQELLQSGQLALALRILCVLAEDVPTHQTHALVEVRASAATALSSGL